MLDLVLIRAHGRDDGYRALPYGLLSIAAYLEKHGFSVKIIDRMKDYESVNRCAKIIKELSPRMIGISALSTQSKDAIKLGKKLKELRFSAKIICGGQHFTALPDEGLRFGDAVIKGEGEEVLLKFCRINTQDINGIYEGQGIENLDEIPLPSDAILKNLYQRSEAPFTLLTCRGCYFKCLFCRKDDYRCNVRCHSVGYTCNYLEKMVNLFDIKSCFIADDVFTFDKNRVISFCNEIKNRNLKLEFSCFTHANINDLDMYKKMKDAGFRQVQIGIESGNNDVLKILKKQQTIQDCIKTIEIIKGAGLSPIPLFMIGNITETEETIKDTIKLAKRLRSICEYGWFSYAQPFPGSEFYEIAGKYGRVVNRDLSSYWNTRVSFIPKGLTMLKMRKLSGQLAKVLRPVYPSLGKRIKSKIKILFKPKG
ncbi:MAG: radical SAM protein [Candidatus Omnitrophota bacterium]